MSDEDGQEPDHHASARGSGLPEDPRHEVIKQIEEAQAGLDEDQEDSEENEGDDDEA